MNNSIEKSLAAALEPIVEDILNLEERVAEIKLMPGPQGEPGKDADPHAVAIILANEHLEKLRGVPGRDAAPVEVDIEDVVKALLASTDFISMVKGRDAQADEVATIIKADTTFTASLTGLQGVGLKSIEQGADECVIRFTLTDGKEFYLEFPRPAPGRDSDPEVVAEILSNKYAEVLRGRAGKDGRDADPVTVDLDDVKKALMDSPEFIAMIKGDTGPAGKDANTSEIVDQLYLRHGDKLRGADGEKGERGETGPAGENADPVVVAEKLYAIHGEELRGPAGDRGQQGETGPAGPAGKSVNADEVAVVLKGDREFRDSIKGETGEAGAGITVPSWNNGVYRKDTIVQHHLGRYFFARKDTAGEPGECDDWERIGCGGFRWMGVKRKDAEYEEGDIYIDGGSLFMWVNGKGRMAAQRGKAGENGKDGAQGPAGKDAPVLIAMQMDADLNLKFIMSDGGVFDADFGPALDSAVSAYLARDKAISFMDEQMQRREAPDATPIDVYRGVWRSGTRYVRGDAVTYNRGLYLATKTTSGSTMEAGAWAKISGGSMRGGSSGSGGWPPIISGDLNMMDFKITHVADPRPMPVGANDAVNMQTMTDAIEAATGWPPTVTGDLDMQVYRVINMNDPRAGAAGLMDAVNRQTLDQAILDASVYRGLWQVEEQPTLVQKLANIQFHLPVAGESYSSPGGAVPPTRSIDIAVWFEFGGQGFDVFPATLSAPVPVKFAFSNATTLDITLPAKTYASIDELQSELQALIAGSLITGIYTDNTNGLPWIGVETLAPLFLVTMLPHSGGGYPPALIDPHSYIGDNYQWTLITPDLLGPWYMYPGVPGVEAGTIVRNGDILLYSADTATFSITPGNAFPKDYSDIQYWQTDNGNMAWMDSMQYFASAVVLYANQWWQAQIDVSAGSPSPDVNSAWRKINGKIAFELIVSAALVDGSGLVLLQGLGADNALYEIQITDPAGGADYRFSVNAFSSNAAQMYISPVSIFPADAAIQSFGITYDATDGLKLVGIFNAIASGRALKIEVACISGDLSQAVAPVDVAPTVMPAGKCLFYATKPYPSADLLRFLQAQSNQPQAAVAGGLTLGSNVRGERVPLEPGKIHKFSGYWKTTLAVPAYIQITKEGTRMTPLPLIAVSNLVAYKAEMSADWKGTFWAVDWPGTDMVGVAESGYKPKIDTPHPFTLSADLRDPDQCIFRFETHVRDTGTKYFLYGWVIICPATENPDGLIFTGDSTANVIWRVYHDQ